MDKLLSEFRTYLFENSAENTALSYLGDVNKFIKEFNVVSVKLLCVFDREKIEDYLTSLKSAGMAYSSISRTIASLKKFFAFCKQKGIINENPVEKVGTVNIRRKLPITLTAAEVEKLLDAPDVSNIKGIRDKAMLEVMYATGARVSELIGMKVGDVSLKNEMVVLYSGGKHRFVPLGKVAVDSLLVYLKSGRPKIATANAGDVLFLNFYGQPLTRQGFWKIVKYYIKTAGIKGNVTAQTIRHSFALHLLKNGADADSVAEMLGFNDVSSTKIYMEVMNNKIKEVYQSAHPRA